MAKSVKIVIGVLILTGLVAIIVSRLTVAHVLVGNRTALGAHSIETALSNYEVEHGHYPPLEFNLDELAVGRDGGPYLSGPIKDAWGRPFRYTLVDGKPKVYSAGPDGVFGTKDDIYAGGLECKTRYVFR
jgi:Type II secretion system (T2SS), protein G